MSLFGVQDPITRIEEAAAGIIRNLRTPAYRFDWGTVNETDEAKMRYPAADVETVSEANNDEVNSPHSGSYKNALTLRITAHVQIPEDAPNPEKAINAYLNYALDDLKRAFGRNYHLNDNCDIILYRGMSRQAVDGGGTVLKTRKLITTWLVKYEQNRLNPERIGY